MMMMNFGARVRQQKHGTGKLSFNTIIYIYSDKCSVHYLIFFFRVLPGKTKVNHWLSNYNIFDGGVSWLGLVGLTFFYDCFSDSYESVNPQL